MVDLQGPFSVVRNYYQRVSSWLFSLGLDDVFLPLYILGIVLLSATAAVASQPFDDAVLLQHADWYFYLGVNPAYFWLEGLYSTAFLVGFDTPSVVLQQFGLHNVLIQQFFLKLPFIIATALTGLIIKRIVEKLGVGTRLANIAAVAWIFNPISFYVTSIHGSPMALAVFFVALSLWLLIEGRWALSSIAYGVAISTYLYPVFAIPYLLWTVNKGKGAKPALASLGIVVATVAVGTVPVLLSGGIGGGAGSLLSSTPSIVANQLGASGPSLYSIFDILDLTGTPSLFSPLFYFTLFVVGMIFPNVPFIYRSAPSDWKRDLVLLLVIEGILFNLLNPANTPQYLVAIVPFAIILASTRFDSWLLSLLTALAAFDAMTLIAWNPHALFSFLQSTNPNLLSFSQTLPLYLLYFFGFLYGLTLLVTFAKLLGVFSRRNRDPSTLPGRKAAYYLAARRHSTQNALVVGVVTLVAFTLVSPSLANPPRTMGMLDSLNSWSLAPSKVTFSSEANSTLTYNLPGLFDQLPSGSRDLVNASINTGGLSDTIYEWFAINSTFQFGSTSYIAQEFVLNGSYSNIEFQLLALLDAADHVQLTVCPNLPPATCDPLVEETSSNATVSSTPAGGRLLTFQTNTALPAGTYYLIIKADQQDGYELFGSSGFPSGRGIQPIILNGVLESRSTLALAVYGQPKPAIMVDSVALPTASYGFRAINDTVTSWFAINTSFEFNSSAYVAQQVDFAYNYTSLNISILANVTSAPHVVLRLCGELPPDCLAPVFTLLGSHALVQSTPANGRLMTFLFNGSIPSGADYLVISGDSAGNYPIYGSAPFPSGMGIHAVIVNGTSLANETLALVVRGSHMLLTIQPVGGAVYRVPYNLLKSTTGVVLTWPLTETEAQSITLNLSITEDSYVSNPASGIVERLAISTVLLASACALTSLTLRRLVGTHRANA